MQRFIGKKKKVFSLVLPKHYGVLCDINSPRRTHSAMNVYSLRDAERKKKQFMKRTGNPGIREKRNKGMCMSACSQSKTAPS